MLPLSLGCKQWLEKHKNSEHHYPICSRADVVGDIPVGASDLGFRPLRAIPHYYLDLVLQYLTVVNVQDQQEIKQKILDLFNGEEDSKVVAALHNALGIKIADKRMYILKQVSVSVWFLIIVIISL